MDMNRIIITACKLKGWWKYSSYQERQNLQKMGFPDGLIWDKENDKPRTIRENTALMYMQLITKHLQESPGQEKAGKSFDFPAVVGQTGKSSNLLEDFLPMEKWLSILRLLGDNRYI